MDYTRTDFREHFWGSKHNGFTVLYQNMKAEALTGKDLVEFVKERSSAEEQYAKHLAKITKQISVSSLATHGSFAPYWVLLKESTEKLSTVHLQVVSKLHDLNRDLLRYNEDLSKRQKLRKDQESETVDVVQAMQTTETALQKAKEVYLLRYFELEKLKKDDASPKDIEKSENKLRKVTEEYQTLVDRYGKTRAEFQDKMCRSCENFQELEEQHLSQLKNIFNNYVISLEFGYTLIGELYDEMRRESNHLTTEKLLMSFVDEKGTGCDRPAEIKFDALHMDIPAMLNAGSAGAVTSVAVNPATGANGVVISKANTGGSLLSTVINPTLTGAAAHAVSGGNFGVSGANNNLNNVAITLNNNAAQADRRNSPLPGRDSHSTDLPTFSSTNSNNATAAAGNSSNRPLSPPSLIHLGESPVMDTRKFFPTVTSSYSITSTTSTSAGGAVAEQQQQQKSCSGFVATTTSQQQGDPFTPPPNVVVSMTRSNTGGRAVTSNNNGYADLVDSRPQGADGTTSPTTSNLNESTTTISNNNMLLEQQTGNKTDKSGGGSGGRGSKWPGFLKFGNRDKSKQQQYAASHAAAGVASRPVNNSHTIHISGGGAKKLNTTTTTTTGNFDGVFEVSPNWFSSAASSTPTNTVPVAGTIDSHLSKVSSNSSLGAKHQLSTSLQKGGTLNSVGLDSVGNYSPTMSDDFHLDEEGYRVRKPTALESDSMRNKLDNTSSASDDSDDDEDNDADTTKKIHVRIRDKAEMLDGSGGGHQKQALEQAARVLIAPQLTGGRGIFTAARTGGSMASSNWPAFGGGVNGKPGDSSMLTMTPSKTGGATASGVGGSAWMTGGAAGHPVIPNRAFSNRPPQSRQTSVQQQQSTVESSTAAAQVPPRMLRPAYTGGPMMSNNQPQPSTHATSYATSMSVNAPSDTAASGRNARSRPRPSSTVNNFATTQQQETSPTAVNNSNNIAGVDQFRRPSAVPIPERQSKPSNAAITGGAAGSFPQVLPNNVATTDTAGSSGAIKNGLNSMVGASGVEPFPVSVNLQEKCSVQLDYAAANSSAAADSSVHVSGALIGEVYLAFPYKSIETLDANSPTIAFNLTPPADAVAPVSAYQPFDKLLKSVPADSVYNSSSSQFAFNMAALVDYLRTEYRKASKPYILVPAVRYNVKMRSVEQLPFQLLAQCRYSSNRARVEIELDRLSLPDSTPATAAARVLSRLALKVRLVLSKGGGISTNSDDVSPVKMQSIEYHTSNSDAVRTSPAAAAVTKDLNDNSIQLTFADISSDRTLPSSASGNNSRSRRSTPLVVIEFNYDTSNSSMSAEAALHAENANDSAGRAVVVPQIQIEAHFQPSSTTTVGGGGQHQQQQNNCLLSGMQFVLESNITQRFYRVAFLKQQFMSTDMNVVPVLNFVPFLPAYTPATNNSAFRRTVSPLEGKRSYDSPRAHQAASRASSGNAVDDSASAAAAGGTQSANNTPTKLIRSLHDINSMTMHPDSTTATPPGVALRRRVSNSSVPTTTGNFLHAYETDAALSHHSSDAAAAAAGVDYENDDDELNRHQVLSSSHPGDVTPTANTASRTFIASGSSAGGGSTSAAALSYDWLGPSTSTSSGNVKPRMATAEGSTAPVTYDLDANWILGSKRRPSLTTTTTSPTNTSLPTGLGSFDQPSSSSLQKPVVGADLPSSAQQQHPSYHVAV